MAAGLSLLAFVPGSLGKGDVQSAATCKDDPQGTMAQYSDFHCDELQSPSNMDFDWYCDGYFYDFESLGCETYVWQLCPHTCDRCNDYLENPGECSEPEFSQEAAAVDVVGVIIFCCCCCVLPLGWICGNLFAWCYACQQRNIAIQETKAGRPPKKPDNIFALCCCGAQVLYYWEGCSVGMVITCLLWPWYPLCCWNKSLYPMENGVMVQPRTQVPYGGSVTSTYVQPAGAQPAVQGTYVSGPATTPQYGQPVQASIVGAPAAVGPATIVGVPAVGQPVIVGQALTPVQPIQATVVQETNPNLAYNATPSTGASSSAQTRIYAP